MDPLILKTTCERATATKQGSNAMLVIEVEALPSFEPGKPPQRVARTLVQLNFNDQTARSFVPGKTYEVTIREV